MKILHVWQNEYARRSSFSRALTKAYGDYLYVPILLNSSLTRPASGDAGDLESRSCENAMALSVVFAATPLGPGTSIDIIEAPGDVAPLLTMFSFELYAQFWSDLVGT